MNPPFAAPARTDGKVVGVAQPAGGCCALNEQPACDRVKVEGLIDEQFPVVAYFPRAAAC